MVSTPQISGVFLCRAMIRFKTRARRLQEGGESYEMKPLPPEPDVIPRCDMRQHLALWSPSHIC